MKLKLLFLTYIIAFTVNAQKIFTVAGFQQKGAAYKGDGGLADTAQLEGPTCTALDAAGNLYITDQTSNLVRKVNTAGIISTFAGTGGYGYTGDGGAATAATFNGVRGITVDATGNIYISDVNNGAIRMVNTAGIISTYAGGGFGPDNATSIGAFINQPYGICFDITYHEMYIVENGGSHLRKIDVATNMISTIAGSAAAGSMGDGGAATSCELHNPTDVACDFTNKIYICDYGNNRIRVIDGGGIINNYAGNASNISGFSGDGGAATAAKLNAPVGIAFDATGNLYVTDQGNSRIRKVVASTGIISTIAGTVNGGGYNGDAILASTAQLSNPLGITVVANGTSGTSNIYVADGGNYAVREITTNCIEPTIITQPTLGPICLGSNGAIYAGNYLINATGYQWQVNHGAGWVNQVGSGYINNFDTINNVHLNQNGWKYRCTLKGCNNVFTDSVTLVVSHPNIAVSNKAICPGNPATLFASGADTYTWSTSPNDTLNQITETTTVTTTYTVTGTNTVTTCTFSAVGAIIILTAPVPDICLVTTDTMSINNIIYWDKTPYNNVDSFIVYRQVQTGVFKRIGAQPYSALSQFTDTARSIGPSNGDPNITTYQYKLQTRDTCGNYSAMSPYHNTIHVTNTSGTFSWNLYSVEGTTVTPVSTFDLMRDNANTGNFISIGSAAGNQTGLTDPNYSSFASIANWRVDANGFNCNPTLRLNGNNSVDAAKVKSHSNQNNNRQVGINKITNTNGVSIYPNPATNVLNINFANLSNKASVKIVDVIGNEVLSTTATDNNTALDISNLAPGTYMVQISSDNVSLTKKITKQ